MPEVLQGVILFLVGSVVVYALVTCVGRGAQASHDKNHGHGGHGHH